MQRNRLLKRKKICDSPLRFFNESEKMQMKLNFDFTLIFNEEQQEWAKLTPRQRYIESSKLWSTYLALGGSLDPEPDSQSPFNFPELQCSVPPHGRPGVYFIRRR